MLEVRGGSRPAFEALFERYKDAIWRFYRRRIDDPGRAEELVQDVFVAILQGARRYEPRAAFRTYLFGIAYNLLLAERRAVSAIAPSHYRTIWRPPHPMLMARCGSDERWRRCSRISGRS